KTVAKGTINRARAPPRAHNQGDLHGKRNDRQGQRAREGSSGRSLGRSEAQDRRQARPSCREPEERSRQGRQQGEAGSARRLEEAVEGFARRPLLLQLDLEKELPMNRKAVLYAAMGTLAAAIAVSAPLATPARAQGAGEKTGQYIDDSVLTTKVKTALLAEK